MLMIFHVYLWLSDASQEAEVFQIVQAENPHRALAAVMRSCGLPLAAAAWVVPQDDALDDYSESPVFGATQPAGWSSVIEGTR